MQPDSQGWQGLNLIAKGPIELRIAINEGVKSFEDFSGISGRYLYFDTALSGSLSMGIPGDFDRERTILSIPMRRQGRPMG